MKRTDVLMLLLESVDQEYGWDKDDRSRAKRPPESVLKYLASMGYVEVETRRCSPWLFGPSCPYYIKHGQSQAQHEATKREYKEFQVKYGGQQEWSARSEVWARLTDRGMQFMANEGLLD